MAGIANRMQMFDEIFKTVLLQADPHGEPLVQRGWAENLPTAGSALDTLVLHLEVIPAFVRLSAQRGPNEEGEYENLFQHHWAARCLCVRGLSVRKEGESQSGERDWAPFVEFNTGSLRHRFPVPVSCWQPAFRNGVRSSSIFLLIQTGGVVGDDRSPAGSGTCQTRTAICSAVITGSTLSLRWHFESRVLVDCGE